MKEVFDRTLNDSSTVWSGISGMYGALTFSEWCLLITVIVTILNFLKNFYIDMKKLKMLQKEHQIKVKGKTDEIK